MPIDWTKYLATNQTKDYLADKGATRVQTASNGAGDLISRIIQAQFGDQLTGINTKISPDKPPGIATVADYSPAQDTIRLGKVSAPMSISETVAGKGKGNTWNADYMDTATVLDGVATTMHEIYHARSQKNPIDYTGSKTLGSDWKSMLKDASNFPSVDGSMWGGDNLQEFLASAVTITEMRKKGMTLTSGTFAGLPEKLDELSDKYKWLPAFIKENSTPEVPKQAIKPAPRTGIVGSILDFFN